MLESWLDDEAKRFTGISDGWEDYYAYWAQEEGVEEGESFWVLLAGEEDMQIAFVLGQSPDGMITVSECFADPNLRGKGIGTEAFCELLDESECIIGKTISKAHAVVYPNNHAARRFFEKCGFKMTGVHPDGDALFYDYSVDSPE